MKNLLLSFTGTLHLIARGKISREELMEAFFAFGCTREHALAPWLHECNELMWAFKHPDGKYDDDRAAIGHRLLIEAILKAEADGRAIWRKPDGGITYRQLDEMLGLHGVPPVSMHLDERELLLGSISGGNVRVVAALCGLHCPR